MADISNTGMIREYLQSNTNVEITPEASEIMEQHLNILSNTILRKAEAYCYKDQRKQMAGNDIAKAFKAVGGGLIGNIKYHTVNSDYLKSEKRDIIVYLPPSYDKNKTKNYPVIYMHDGQNLFDKSTGFMGKEWFVNDKVEHLINQKIINEIIIVGVYNSNERLEEYTWTYMEGEGGGKGKTYGDFLTKELIPFINNKYRTLSDREHTGVLGSSLGGLISFYLALHYPDFFSKIGIMSPSLWWNKREAIRDAEGLNVNTSFDFWLDAGTMESNEMVDDVLLLKNVLTNKYGEDHILEYTEQNASHNEEAWSERMHGPIIQFFGPQETLAEKEKIIINLMNNPQEWTKL